MATRLSQYRAVMPALIEQRAAPRHCVTVTRARVARRGSPPVETQLSDLSIYGCRLAGAVPHGEGVRIWLRIRDDLPIAATIIWNDGTQIGCRFDTPIGRELMRSLALATC